MTQSYLDLTREISAGIQQLRAEIPDTLRGFSAMAQAAGKPGVLDAKTKEITNKDAEITRLNKELGDLKEKVAQDIENTTWAALKNTLPKAWTETADAEAKTRTEWKDNKDAFLLKVANLKRVPDTTEAGKEFENNTTDAIAIQRKLLAASGRMR